MVLGGKVANQVAILHGWSDTSASFKSLVAFLKSNGFQAVPLWLGDYVSMDDDVRIEDVVKRMEEVVNEKVAAEELTVPFDLIVHSTGGLVARRWLADCYASKKRHCPVTRMVMLAPANFGSRLAATGKSMLGRIFKGYNNFFQTGTEMLNALELASPFQWDLARRDLFVPEGIDTAPAVYGINKGQVMPFVIIGTHPYPSGPRQIVNENGSDGTVRVAAGNLNAHGMTVDFSADNDQPVVTAWDRRHGDLAIPFAVLPNRDHTTVTLPDDPGVKAIPEVQQMLGRLMLQALSCREGDYAAVTGEWEALSEETAALAADKGRRNQVFLNNPRVAPEYFHQYCQIIVRVEDDHGAPVPDFFLEFFGPRTGWAKEAVLFHSEVLEHVHNNSQGTHTRSLFIDRTDLVERFYDAIPDGNEKVLKASIAAAAPGPNVTYFDNRRQQSEGSMVVHALNDQHSRWLRRNCTHFVRIIIPRVPVEKVFRMTRG